VETVQVLVMGSLVRRNYHCTIAHGTAGRELLAGLSVDRALMACSSFSAEKGASTPDINQAETKKLMMSIGAKVIVLFHASKMGRTSSALFAPFEAEDAIVTDSIDAEDRAHLEENGIDVLTAG
jgi:DeoR family transcriptional regulator, fructose operon transcriptional repressor